MYGYIYITENLINNKKYIGKKKSNIFNPDYLGSGIRLKKAIIKYGRENFSVKLLEECFSLEELNNKEKYYIRLYDAVNSNKFYNIASGGDGGILWKTRQDHPSLGKPGRQGNQNGMHGKSMFEVIGEDRAAEVKQKIATTVKQYYKDKHYVYVHKGNLQKRILITEVSSYIKDGWMSSNSCKKQLKSLEWYKGKPCLICKKPMEVLYGSGIYCSASCAHKRVKSEEEKLRIKLGRLNYESSLSEEEKQNRAIQAKLKWDLTMSGKSEEELLQIKNNRSKSHTGKRLTEETKLKISNSLKQKKNK